MPHELDDHALLLMYLAGELPEGDRIGLEARLAGDAGLRQELADLSDAMERFEAGMNHIDQRPLPAESVVVRRIGLAMRRQLALQAVNAPPSIEAGKPPVRYPVWAYPAVGAAVVLLAMLSWWGHRPSTLLVLPSMPGVSPTTAPNVSVTETPQFVQSMMGEPTEEADPAHAKAVAHLDAAQEQIADLKNSRAETDAYFGITDANE